LELLGGHLVLPFLQATLWLLAVAQVETIGLVVAEQEVYLLVLLP
jgi:hypothetical protein